MHGYGHRSADRIAAGSFCPNLRHKYVLAVGNPRAHVHGPPIHPHRCCHLRVQDVLVHAIGRNASGLGKVCLLRGGRRRNRQRSKRKNRNLWRFVAVVPVRAPKVALAETKGLLRRIAVTRDNAHIAISHQRAGGELGRYQIVRRRRAHAMNWANDPLHSCPIRWNWRSARRRGLQDWPGPVRKMTRRRQRNNFSSCVSSCCVLALSPN